MNIPELMMEIVDNTDFMKRLKHDTIVDFDLGTGSYSICDMPKRLIPEGLIQTYFLGEELLHVQTVKGGSMGTTGNNIIANMCDRLDVKPAWVNEELLRLLIEGIGPSLSKGDRVDVTYFNITHANNLTNCTVIHVDNGSVWLRTESNKNRIIEIYDDSGSYKITPHISEEDKFVKQSLPYRSMALAHCTDDVDQMLRDMFNNLEGMMK